MHKRKFEYAKQLFQSNKILNVCELNILNDATFMYKVNQKTTPNVFLSRFQKPPQQPIHNTKTSKYSISVRGPYICNRRYTNHYYA